MLWIRIVFVWALTVAGALPALSQDSLVSHDIRYSYLKFSVFPFFYSAFRTNNNESLWLILQYESQLRPASKFTYNLVVDFHSYESGSGKLTFNGMIDFVVRPQIRYYPGRRPYHGYFIGAFPMYYYSGGTHTINANYYGGGVNTGAQFFIVKVPIEFNIFYSMGWGYEYSTQYFTGEKLVTPAKHGYGSIELNVGLPVRKKK